MSCLCNGPGFASWARSQVTTDERRQLEGVITKALLALRANDTLRGDYHPLHGSESYDAKPGGMSDESEAAMRSTHMLFGEPSAPDMVRRRTPPNTAHGGFTRWSRVGHLVGRSSASGRR